MKPTEQEPNNNLNPKGVQLNQTNMATFTQLLYQIVFSTKNAENTMELSNTENLYRYIWGILKNKNCVLYRVNGTENHIHIVTHIHPSVSISTLVKDVKVSSSGWIKEHRFFPKFKSWQEGYGGFSYHITQKETLVNYVKNQRENHHIKNV